MLALIFNKSRLAREYTSKSGEKMVVLPMFFPETGGIGEQHFTKETFDTLEITDDMYYSHENPVVCRLETADAGLNKKIVGIEIAGTFDYKVK